MDEANKAEEPKEEIILIVDDNPTNISILVDYLDNFGYRILIATNGKRALKIVEGTLPDIVLLDVMMPELDGYETCRILKSQKRTQDIPIIFMTALTETSDKMKAFGLGAVDFITKPMQQEEVYARVKTHLTIQQQRRQLECQNEELNIYARRLKERERALEEANARLKMQATTDELTGICNRRTFFERAISNWSISLRQKSPVGIMMIDIDHFKLYNDTYGHQAGDTCLQKVASTLADNLKRASDVLARYGGEEFIVMVSGQSGESLGLLAEKLCRVIREEGLVHEASTSADVVTISMGVACTIPHKDLALEGLIAIADEALYEAKRDGRNRHVLKHVDGPGEKT